jgi:hypothetical protein
MPAELSCPISELGNHVLTPGLSIHELPEARVEQGE